MNASEEPRAELDILLEAEQESAFDGGGIAVGEVVSEQEIQKLARRLTDLRHEPADLRRDLTAREIRYGL